MSGWGLWSHLGFQSVVYGVTSDVRMGFMESPRISGRGLWSLLGCQGGVYGVTSDFRVGFIESPQMGGVNEITSDVGSGDYQVDYLE